MPNVKVYVDEAVYPDCRASLAAALGPIRDMLCDALQVAAPACQFAVIPVLAMPDLPTVNVEMLILPRPERNRTAILAVCEKLRDMVTAATGSKASIRVTILDPETYIALK